MRIVVTGGAGFIGSALCRLLIGETDHLVLNLDKLTYAGTLESLRSVANSPRYQFMRADICDRPAIDALFRDYRPDAVRHGRGPVCGHVVAAERFLPEGR